MEEIEYEIPTRYLMRLTQQDISDKFDIIIKDSSKEGSEIQIHTTINKARVISKQINEMYRIDPTISEYTIALPGIYEKADKSEKLSGIARLRADIETLLESSAGKAVICCEQESRLKIVLGLLGDETIEIGDIDMKSTREAISYLNTELHEESIGYLSSHLNEILDDDEITQVNEDIIYEIIDSYFEQKRTTNQENTENTENSLNAENVDKAENAVNADKVMNAVNADKVMNAVNADKVMNAVNAESVENDEIVEDNDEEIFEKLMNKFESGVVLHFLLGIENYKYTLSMKEYIRREMTDCIAARELRQIVGKFFDGLDFPGERVIASKPKNTTNFEFKGDELKGIIFNLGEKYGPNLCDSGEMEIHNSGRSQYSSGLLSNLIKYDNFHLNDFYMSSNGMDLPNENEAWIEFDFKKRKINMTSYTLRTSILGSTNCYHAKSWRIVGSNDLKEWEVLDKQVNNSSLNGCYKQHRFECVNNHKYYRYIRFIQDDSWCEYIKHIIFLTCVEFFGSISTQ